MSARRQAGLVSVIIPVYNQPSLILDCVASVLAQQYREFEIIITDDGSTDQTCSVLDSLTKQHSNLRVFRQTHKGGAAARETGRLNARGEYLQYLNCNDRLAPDKLAIQVSALKTASDVDIVCGDDSGSKQGLSNGTQRRARFLFPRLLNQRVWQTAAPLYRRRLTDRVGPWLDVQVDETWEYEARIARLGAIVKWLDEPSGAPWTWHVASVDLAPIDTTRLFVDRTRVQARIYRAARAYEAESGAPTKFDAGDWRNFSQQAFALSRHCAKHQMTTQARAMLSLSIEANGRKSPRHRLYIKLIGWFGWQRAAKLLK